MLVIFETLEKELLKVDLEHVPSKGEVVTVFDTVYQVDNVMYETTIRIKPSGKRGVKQIATCEISPIVLGDFQADKKDDKWQRKNLKTRRWENEKLFIRYHSNFNYWWLDNSCSSRSYFCKGCNHFTCCVGCWGFFGYLFIF